MVCRNKDKAEEAREDIVNQSGNTVSVGEHEVMQISRLVRKSDPHLFFVLFFFPGGTRPYC